MTVSSRSLDQPAASAPGLNLRSASGKTGSTASPIGTPPTWLHDAQERTLSTLIRFLVIVVALGALTVIQYQPNAFGYVTLLLLFVLALLLRRTGLHHELTVFLLCMSLVIGILTAILAAVHLEGGLNLDDLPGLSLMAVPLLLAAISGHWRTAWLAFAVVLSITAAFLIFTPPAPAYSAWVAARFSGTFTNLQAASYELARPLVLFAGVTLMGRFTNRMYLATLQQLDVASGLAWERQQANEALSILIATQQQQERTVTQVMADLDNLLWTQGIRASIGEVGVATGAVDDQHLQFVLHLHRSALARLQSALRDAAIGQQALLALRQMQRHWSILIEQRKAWHRSGLRLGEGDLLAGGVETASPAAAAALHALRAAELEERRALDAQRTAILLVMARAANGEQEVRAPHELQGTELWPIAHALNVLLDAHQRQLAATREGPRPAAPSPPPTPA